MKIFIDSADLGEIRRAFEWGVADGVTTNPSLLKKAVDKQVKAGAKVKLGDYITDILATARGTPVSLEVTETAAEGMIKEGKKLFNIFNPVAGNVCVKIPVNPAFKDEDDTHFDGIKAVRALSKAGIPVNCTLIFTPEQALLASKAGASFVSPFAGRLDDFVRTANHISFDKAEYYPMDGLINDDSVLEDNGVVSGIDLVGQCVQILRNYKYEAKVLAASLRNPRQVREAALVGADIATLPFTVIADMLKHYKTYEGMYQFTKDVVPEYAKLKEK